VRTKVKEGDKAKALKGMNHEGRAKQWVTTETFLPTPLLY